MPSLRIQDQDLYYDWTRAGDDGLILVFIHGLGSSNSFYAPIIPSLVEAGYSCLAFDTPGSALSNYRGIDSDAEMMCGAASALISALDLDSRRVIVVGHSMGAVVASELALHLNLVGVVLIGPVSPSDALSQVFAARIKRVQAGGMEAMASTIPAAATGPKATSTHRAFIRALLLAQSPEGYMSLCRTIASAKCPRYGDIRCPLLIVAGSHDQTSPLRGSRDILSRSLIALDAVSVAAANTPQMGG
ncbi:alpha/beta hydrolase fold family protein [Ophiocordyceps sinensis CO18]|uniref:Alpha/beta hydrolase fold family protein n=1 Tax=Ophiocordyceps sinensis (strain Co18 / CGMCC 3.14243) TaxID=911162 RepID=T5A8X1_OPHSC|nr:alpha/beta hydrolase fold family protein [Ophiocordyceps sinensis CO18]